MNIKTGKQLAEACLNLANNYKTLYVLGCFGAPLTNANKERYFNHQSYNRRPDRKTKIKAASADTFGFDCVCMIKGLMWGWDGNKNDIYGGASYATNGVPDYSANGMINICSGVSSDFSDIVEGEAVWMKDHIGIYIGDGLAVECTPRWKDGVQVTAVYNISKNAGYNGRKWTKHGRLPYLTYEKKPAPAYSKEQFIRDVQKALKVTVDGVAGPNTLNATVTLSATTNRTHPVVVPVQKYLAFLGYAIVGPADGCTGSKFKKAVVAYQTDHPECGWKDGVISARHDTWKSLLGMSKITPENRYSRTDFIKDVQKACGAYPDGIYGPETLNKTVTVSATINRMHPVVVPLQKRLYALGYTEVGSADGCTGSNFDKAVKHFQNDHTGYADGEITAKRSTWQKLLTI